MRATVLADAAFDAVGNGNVTGSFSRVYDPVPPSVVSIVRVGASPTAASQVLYTVTFSESVSGVDKGDFNLTPSGLSGVSILAVSGQDVTRTVTVGTGKGNGTLRLNVVDNDSIRDGAGNPLGGAGAGNGAFAAGQVYQISGR